MKKLILIPLCASLLFAADLSEQELELRKRELSLKIREFDEARQALEAYKASFEALQQEKMQALLQKESEVNASLARIEALREENAKLLKQNEELLSNIDEKSSGKIKEIYSQMKDANIANVLAQMSDEEAYKVMMALEPRKISGILSKMDPKKASNLTLLLKNVDLNTDQTNANEEANLNDETKTPQ